MLNQKNRQFREFIAKQLAANSVRLSDIWLSKLENVVNESARDIFPTDQYLDHIPSMIDEIGSILLHKDEDSALVNSLIQRKAMELGSLRHSQQATVNQLLREYEILADVLQSFLAEVSMDAEFTVDCLDAIDTLGAVERVVRSIQQFTVDAFIEKYMSTIGEQTDKLSSFNKFVSHELKTPLQAAMLNLELLMEGKDPTESETLDLLRVKSSIQQASLMLTNIENLMQQNVTSLKDNPVQQESDLSSLIADVKTQLGGTLSDRNVELLVDNDIGVVNAETAKLKLVFSNLLTNAIKYSDPGKAEKKVHVTRVESDDVDSLCIQIKDNGLGIREDKISEVMKLRVRAHEEQDRDHEVTGHGLGLYLVAEALRDLNGKIELESQIGVGTTVTVCLPKVQQAPG